MSDAETPQPVTEQATATGEPPAGRLTAADKLRDTLRALSQPDADAEHLELMLSSLAMAVESTVGGELDGYQANGEIDDFMLVLCRFLAQHRSWDQPELVVVELPRSPEHLQLPAGTRLHQLDEAIAAQKLAASPW